MKRLSTPEEPKSVWASETEYNDGPALLLEWLDDESIGYTDYYPVSWFANMGKHTGFIHITQGPRGGIYQAKCDVNVLDSTALLDYGPYMKEFNEMREMLPGTAKLVFKDETRTQFMDHAFWRKPGGAFIRYSIASGAVPSLRAQVSAIDDLPSGDSIGTANPPKRTGTTTFFIRDERVRKAVRRRANGRCEYCGVKGFLTSSKTCYLETHHVIGLSAGGPDTMNNVIALCANDHREAHFGVDRDAINTKMFKTVQRLEV